MTKLQKTILKGINDEGYVALRDATRATCAGIQRMAGEGVRCYSTGLHTGMARTATGAMMACMFANNRSRIRRYTDAVNSGNTWLASLLLEGKL